MPKTAPIVAMRLLMHVGTAVLSDVFFLSLTRFEGIKNVIIA